MDAGFDDGDDKGGRGGAGGGFCRESELFGVVGDEGSDEEDAEDVEDYDTPEGQFDGARNDFARVLGFADCDADELGSEIGEGCGDKGGPEA